MACKNICTLCKRLVISNAITYASGVLTINIPAGIYLDGEKYCIVLAQNIPDTAIINAPVVITLGSGTTTYNLQNKDGTQIVASQLRTRTRYSTRVHTNANTGVFRLLSQIPSNQNTLNAIT